MLSVGPLAVCLDVAPENFLILFFSGGGGIDAAALGREGSMKNLGVQADSESLFPNQGILSPHLMCPAYSSS